MLTQIIIAVRCFILRDLCVLLFPFIREQKDAKIAKRSFKIECGDACQGLRSQGYLGSKEIVIVKSAVAERQVSHFLRRLSESPELSFQFIFRQHQRRWSAVGAVVGIIDQVALGEQTVDFLR